MTGQRRDAVLAQIVQKEPRPPRKLNRRVPVDLETICLKALEKDPDRRYQTAGAMAEDLRRYVNRFAIAARRVGPLGRMRKWVRRHPALAAALALALVLAGAAGFFAYQAYAGEQRRLAEQKAAEERLLAEQRQNALDKGMVAAMGGDWDGAEQAVAEAERLGASTGQVRVLRGMMAYCRGSQDEAVKQLEQAVALMPKSVSARALLAAAYEEEGLWGQHYTTLAECEKLTPEAPEDYLFMGFAESILDPERGLKAMDEAVRRRPSAIALSLRAAARTSRAEDTANPADAESAMADVDALKGLMRDDALVLRESVYARLAAASAYEATGQPQKREAVLAQARRDVLALAPYADRPEIARVRWCYLEYVEDEDGLVEMVRGAARPVDNGPLAGLYALVQYRRGELDKALEMLGRGASSYASDQLRLCILAELPDGRARALAAYREMAGRRDSPVQDIGLLFFLGWKQEALQASLDLRQHPDQWPRGNWEAFTGSRLDYYCGRISADELLSAAGASRNFQGAAHYSIAVTKLAEGDRDGAREHFRKTFEARATSYWFNDLSWAFLARMESDPAWPPWIPVKK